jgi:hypothetical protein
VCHSRHRRNGIAMCAESNGSIASQSPVKLVIQSQTATIRVALVAEEHEHFRINSNRCDDQAPP